MGRLRKLAKKCKELGKEHADDPDARAVAESGDGGHADWVCIGLTVFQEEINKPLRKYEDYLNEMPGILGVFGLDKSPDYTLFSNWNKEFTTRSLRRLLRETAEQAGLSGQAAIDASGFQRNQTSSHYRKHADYSFGVMKTTLLVDTESLAIRDAHFTTRKSYDGHIGLQVFRRNAEDLRELLADKMYSWQRLREACRERSTRPVIKHKELSPLKKAHNARIGDAVYNQRSMSETVFAMLKTDNSESLRARSWHGQFRELTRKCILHNLSLAVGGNRHRQLLLYVRTVQRHRHRNREEFGTHSSFDASLMTEYLRSYNSRCANSGSRGPETPFGNFNPSLSANQQSKSKRPDEGGKLELAVTFDYR